MSSEHHWPGAPESPTLRAAMSTFLTMDIQHDAKYATGMLDTAKSIQHNQEGEASFGGNIFVCHIRPDGAQLEELYGEEKTYPLSFDELFAMLSYWINKQSTST